MARIDSFKRLRRRILLGTAALIAVLLVLWQRWGVDGAMLLEFADGALLFVLLATLAGGLAGAMLTLARRALRRRK